MGGDRGKSYLTPNEVANLLMVAPVTVRVWAQKGMLQAQTTPGGHRRFLREEVERFARDHGAAINIKETRPLHVMIVDDDRLLTAYLTDLLEGLEKPAVTAAVHDGFEAGYKVHTFKPDVVLLDLMMPGLDGFQVCSRIKQNPATSAVRVIAITGYLTPENVRQVLDAGAEYCLAKPLEKNALLAALGLAPPAAAYGRAEKRKGK